jgi:DNA polymerase elongation subunit (family B)
VNHDEDECELLHAFAKGLEMCGRSVITGWNVRRFDIPFIVARCALHDVKLPDWWPHMRSYTGIVDAMEVLDPDHHYKLKHWLKRFGLPAKTEDGSEVKNMTIQEIADYCANDVIVERLLVRKVMGFCPALFTHAYGEN